MSSQTLTAGFKVQQALSTATLTQELSLQPRVQPVVIPSGTFPPAGSDKRRAGLMFLVVAMLHASGAAWLITRTTEYTPLNLVTPQESTTMQASVVEFEPPPPQVAEQTPVLTAERGEREVAPTLTKPVAPEAPPVAEKPVEHTPPPKPIVKKPQVAKPVAQKPLAPQPEPAPAPAQSATTASTTPGAPIAGSSSGRLMQSNSSAQPKNVAAIGCAVPQPEYPRRAQRLKQEGEVLVRLVINPQGQLTRYEIARSSGFDVLDQAALAAVQKIRCTPYIENGQPIAVMTLQPVSFRLGR